MKKGFFALPILLGLLLTSNPASACDIDGHTGFMPENNMQISVDAKFRSDMTKEDFNAIITRVTDVYGPIIKKKGGVLKMNRLWDNDTVNASAQRSGKSYIVNMYGGLARHVDVSDDGFAMVICHELGHHLGGAPKNGGWMSKWASNEGQSDYWGAMKCFRRVFGDDDNVNLMAAREVDVAATKACQESFTNADEVATCQRAAMAGKSLAKLLNRGQAVSFTTPDTTVVTRTNNRHPAGQCRMDTYFHGALCDKGVDQEVDDRDPAPGVCVRSESYDAGARRLCWFKP